MSKLKEEVKSAQKCSYLDDPLDSVFTEPIAMLFSRGFIKMGVHPNVITLLSCIVGVAGGIFFIFNNIWLNIVGVLLEILAAIFDASDGQVARLANKKSLLGRFFDGVADGLVYTSIYVGISIRLMHECIPFTNVEWGFWIWAISLVVGLIIHENQAKTADYIRNLHMFFVSPKHGHELTRAKDSYKKYENYKGSFLEKRGLHFYYTYTKDQESFTPKTQKLLDEIEKDGNKISQEVKESFAKTSNKFVGLTNLLTYNVRTYLLFVLIILNCFFGGIEAFIFPFVIFILEPIRIFLLVKYEKLAEKIMENFYIEEMGKVDESKI